VSSSGYPYPGSPFMKSASRVLPFLLAAPAAVVVLLLGAAPAPASVATLSFGPEADTYVSSAYPTTTFGTTTAFSADSSPAKQSYLRFDVQGLQGRTVVGARLRLYASDSSPSGGRVFSVSSNDWSEALSWNSRPPIDGPQLGQFGAVTTGGIYETDLGGAVTGDGKITLAINSANSDEVRWASRESTKPPPRLILEVESGDAVSDGLTTVAGSTVGATDPTSYSLQRRLAVTAGGRQLGVFVPHKAGPQLTWRDPAGNWQTHSTGESLTGTLLPGTASGVNPASIVVGRDTAGAERAWVVFGASSTSSRAPIYLRSITDLDARSGPRIGPLVTLPETGSKPDIELATDTAGQSRPVILWSRITPTNTYELVSGWLDESGATPALAGRTVLGTSTSSKLWGTLAAGPDGSVRAIARKDGRLYSYAHQPTAALGSWTVSARGAAASGYGYHSAVTLDSGATLVALESDATARTVVVQRFSAGNAPAAIELSLAGHAQPTLATDGTDAWLVMVRISDGHVVSRQLSGGAWSPTDRVEIGAEGGGGYAHPNAMRRTDGRLRFIVKGPSGGTTSRNSVLAFQRPLSSP
jgi:hypothetical protein